MEASDSVFPLFGGQVNALLDLERAITNSLRMLGQHLRTWQWTNRCAYVLSSGAAEVEYRLTPMGPVPLSCS